MEMGLKVIIWPILGHYFFYYILVINVSRLEEDSEELKIFIICC